MGYATTSTWVHDNSTWLHVDGPPFPILLAHKCTFQGRSGPFLHIFLDFCTFQRRSGPFLYISGSIRAIFHYYLYFCDYSLAARGGRIAVEDDEIHLNPGVAPLQHGGSRNPTGGTYIPGRPAVGGG